MTDITAMEGHVDEVWSLAISTNGKYLVSGGKDRRVACEYDHVRARREHVLLSASKPSEEFSGKSNKLDSADRSTSNNERMGKAM